jgi:hypothetical protein
MKLSHRVKLLTTTGILYCLWEAHRLEQPRKRCAGNFLLPHDNALAHTTLSAQQYLVKNSTVFVQHALHSPDLAPS